MDRHNGAVADDVPTVYDPTALDPAADLASRRRARKWVWAMVGLIFVGILVVLYMGRQSSTSEIEAPKAFCHAANAYEEELGRQQVAYKINTARQIEKVEAIVATAPKAIRADAETFLASLRAVDAAPNAKARERLQDDPDVRQAVENVNRYWNQGCGVFDRQSGI